ncbi:GNAT family N-acetyltransferase [Halobacteriales archaeon QS_8_69_26]|nr:MAG: GNAT family N-acetyltransferase [Halobacteriales archaeon QS_8_69_26]
MDVRQATTSDIEEIRQVARRSLTSSYDFLDEGILDSALEQWYTDDALEEDITEDNDVIIVGTVDGELVGFSQSSFIGADESVGEIQWLHVDPDWRGKGIAAELLDRSEEVLSAAGVDRIRGLVLAGNESGSAFYEEHGFEAAGDRSIRIGEGEYEELFYETGSWPREDADAGADRADIDGESVFVYRDEGDRGSKGMFYPAYRSRDRDELVGWICDCGSSDNAMDSMGRLECNNCGNTRKPTRWDAAYL